MREGAIVGKMTNKFSTSVVVVSCPPAAKPFARKPYLSGVKREGKGSWVIIPVGAARDY
jgi:hypothetical protein